jgi:polyhydroxyalkanoate synthesis regulator phasin
MDDEHDKDSSLSDIVKRVVSIGVGAAFMTEDAVRSVLKDVPLPKEIASGLLQNAKGAKEDFIQGIREEVSTHLAKVDPKKLMEEVLSDYDIEVQAKLSFTKKKKKPNSKKTTKRS